MKKNIRNVIGKLSVFFCCFFFVVKFSMYLNRHVYIMISLSVSRCNRVISIRCNRVIAIRCNRGISIRCNRVIAIRCNQVIAIRCNRVIAIRCNRGITVRCNRGITVKCNREITIRCTCNPGFRTLNKLLCYNDFTFYCLQIYQGRLTNKSVTEQFSIW